MTGRDRTKRLDTIQKLLAQATSVAGTPEAEAFTDRAFQLNAAAGTERLSTKASAQDAGAIVREEFHADGDFLQQRITLLTCIASALHCAHAYWLFSPTVSTVHVYGAQHHTDRVQLLYGPLLTRMLKQATASPWSPSSGFSQHDHQISWMQGFTLSIRARLHKAKTAAGAEADQRSGGTLNVRRHADDAARAEAEKMRRLPRVRRSTYNPPLGRDSLAEGYRAGRSPEPPTA